jgi:hypothetical protein
MFHQGMHDAGKVGNGKGKGGESWYAAMASALGESLDKQAAEITRLSALVSQPGGKDNPSTMTDLTAASQRMGFISNGAMTAINSVGEALSTTARKG